MKKLLLSIALAISGLSIFANAKADITISGPIEGNNQYKIALSSAGKIRGSIEYQRTAPGCWKIQELYIAKELRNQGLGTLLIVSCIQHMLSVGFEKVELDVMPIDTHGPTLDQLISFYTKVFNKICPPSLYTLHISHDEECPWLATVKMVITKNQ